jgi:hypothetical protein
VSKHVFVETNFIVDLVRPCSAPGARALYERDDVVLHVPWVSLVESKRTLKDRIVREDLGFGPRLQDFLTREFLEGRLSRDEKKNFEPLARRVRDEYAAALGNVGAAVDDCARKMDVIFPSERVVDKVLSLYEIKSLPPFDEMVMGAVLAKAEELFEGGERGFYFCNLNKRDFRPGEGTSLKAEYERLTIEFLSDFKVP